MKILFLIQRLRRVGSIKAHKIKTAVTNVSKLLEVNKERPKRKTRTNQIFSFVDDFASCGTKLYLASFID